MYFAMRLLATLSYIDNNALFYFANSFNCIESRRVHAVRCGALRALPYQFGVTVICFVICRKFAST